jgi:guanine deaminase
VYFAAARGDAAAAGFDDELIYRELRVPVEERRIPTEQVAIPSFAEPFEAWRSATQRIRY